MTNPVPPEPTAAPAGPKDPEDANSIGAGDAVALVPLGASVLPALEADLPAVPHVQLRDTADATAAESRTTAPEAPLPAEAGRYRLHGEIARGGMGAILKGRDVDLGRDIAVKVLLAAHQGKTELVQRFVEEAQIAGQLQHPGIAPVYELGQFPDRRPYFTMKLVKGQTFAKLLADRRDPAQNRPLLLKVFEQVCQTLAYAHAKGVIHRDLKPANVMVGAFGEVQVMDWGLAKVLPQGDHPEPATPPTASVALSVIRTARSEGSDMEGSSGSQTQAGSVLGTPAYMPPEQALGEIDRLDERADVFGLGAVLCEILTGQPPYVGKDRDAVLRKAVRADLADALARLDACGAEPELVALTRRCLAAEADHRPRHAGEVAEAMTAYLAGVQGRLRASEIERAAAMARATAERKARRLTVGLAAAVVLLALVGGGAWLSIVRDRDAHESEAIRLADERDRKVIEEIERAKAMRNRGGQEAEALAAARNAQGLLRDDAGVELKQQVHALLNAVEGDRNRRDLVASLEKARMRKADILRLGTVVEYLRSADAAEAAVNEVYGQVFRDWTLEFEGPSPGAALHADWLKPIHKELAAVLDDWAAAKHDAPAQKRLFDLACSLDPDPERKRVRGLLTRPVTKAPPPLAPGQKPLPPDPALEAYAKAIVDLAQSDAALRLAPATITSMASALRGIGNADVASRLLQRAQRHYPQDYWINHDLAFLLLSLAPPAPALPPQVLRLALPDSAGSAPPAELPPPDPKQALADMKAEAARQGQLAEAVRFATVAVALRPDSAGARLTLAEALDSQGRLAAAADVLEKLIALKKTYVIAYVRLGKTLEQLKRPDEARQRYREALQHEADDPGEYYALGVSFALQKQWEDAQTAYEKGIRGNPIGIPNYLSFVVEAVASAKDGQTALAISRRASKTLRERQNRPALYVLGRLLGRRIGLQASGAAGEQERDAALVAFQAVLTTPGDELDYVARYFIGTIQTQKGQVEQAVATLQPALLFKPDCFLAHVALGRALDRPGRQTEAIAEYREALSLLAKWSYEVSIGKDPQTTRNEHKDPKTWGTYGIKFDTPGISYYETFSNGANAHGVALSGWMHSRSWADAVTAHPNTPTGTSAASAASTAATASTAALKMEQRNASASASANARGSSAAPQSMHGTGGEDSDQGHKSLLSSTASAFAATAGQPAVEWLLAAALLGNGQPNEAVAALQKITETIAAACAASSATSTQTQGSVAATVATSVSSVRADFDASPAVRLGLLVLFLEKHHGVADALDAQRKVLAFTPGNLEPYAHIGRLLAKQGKKDAAQAAYRKIIDAGPDPVLGRLALGQIFLEAGKLEEAATAFALVKPTPRAASAAVAQLRLGNVLALQGKRDKALAAYQEGIRLKPDIAALHAAVGNLLWANPDQALAAYLEARRLAELQKSPLELKHPARTLTISVAPSVWLALGVLLEDRYRLDDALAAYARAVRCDPKPNDDAWDPDGIGWVRAGSLLLACGQLADAIKALRMTTGLSGPDLVKLHNNVGVALFRRGRLEDAAAEFRQANAIYHPILCYAPAQNNLGRVLYRQGKREEAEVSFRQAVAAETDSGRAKRMTAVQDRLPRFLKGEYQPATASERRDLAELCVYRGFNRAGAKLYVEAFAADPKLADGFVTGTSTFRYYAVCGAALAAVGEGEDVAGLGETDRARWRGQALEWLRADLKFRAARLAQNTSQAHAETELHMRHWQHDLDLAGIRDHAALAKLPAAERQAFEQFWAHVSALRKRASTQPAQSGSGFE